MSLTPGTRLGPYEILAPLGAGGMGEVYRAKDTRLDRAVAIKVLPAQFAADLQLRERFEREARAISSLQHPHICALFDVGRDGDVDFLVLECLEGETLAGRIARAGMLPIADALIVAIQICDALDRAHRSGIVHRDLKPANVMLLRSGGATAPPTAKLLDFGLAKAAAPVVATSGLSMLPTTPPNITAQGTLLGTFQYMAPEQIEGLEADARTDIFAFGALLFEMLTGRTAFEGKTRASLLGAILKDEPSRVSTVQPLAPKTLDRIVATCLAKDPDDRYQSARDLLRDLKWVASGEATEGGVAVTTPRRHITRTGWAIVAALSIAMAAAGMAVGRLRVAPPPVDPIQFTISAPDNAQFGGPISGGTGQAAQVSVSPDGRHVVFVAAVQSRFTLWIRSVGAVTARSIAGTEDASFPFWSPDGRFIGFFASGKLKKIQVSGGPAIALCDAASGRGGTWNGENVIVFAPAAAGPLLRVGAAGGVPAPATALDKDYGESNHRFPHFLPDGRHFLYTAVTGAAGSAPKPSLIKIGDLASSAATTLFASESSAAFASGHLVFLSDGTLMAQPFDLTALRTRGDPFPIAEQVGSEGSRYATFAISPEGVLVYGRGNLGRGLQLTWFDRTGKSVGTVGDVTLVGSVALSPDEKRAALTLTTGTPPNRDVWVVDLARGVNTRLTFEPPDDVSAVWSPDGRQVAFFSLRQNASGIRTMPSTGGGVDQLLMKIEPPIVVAYPTDWSRDGRFIAYTRGTTQTQFTGGSSDVWVLPLGDDRKPFPIANSRFTEDSATFSPDGRWIAYGSNEAGSYQIYVQPFPPTGAKYQVSRNGGGQPKWRGDGRELFFIGADAMMMSATIDTSRQFEAGVPQPLFPSRSPNTVLGRQSYAVTRDGKRFLIPALHDATSMPLTVVINWLSAVQK
jgi:Tol biopolymer transport system component